MTVSADLAQRLFATLARETADPPGITRTAFGQGEQFAHDLSRREAEALGCEIMVDAVGNLTMTFPGADRTAPCLMVGSHLDSVPHGGNYDGAVGVIAGLGLIAALAARGMIPQRDITVMAFRGEEAAWFPISYLGSYAAVGRLDPQLLETPRSDTGRSLGEHMREAGFDPESVRRGIAQLDPGRIGQFIEVHIEQGPVLIGEGLPVGLVTAINGGFRYMHGRASGVWAHSGATPRAYRHDAVLGFSALATKLETVWDGVDASGKSVTITFGQVSTDAAMHGGSRVAGDVHFSLDVRSAFDEVLAELKNDLSRLSREVEAETGVAIDFGPAFSWPVAAMSPDVIDQLEACARRAGVPVKRMPSGAGHDAAVMAEMGVPTAMLFVRNTNGSHNPDEAMDIADLDQAVSLLTQLVLDMD